MAQEYIKKKTDAILKRLTNLTKNMPSFGKNFITVLIQGSNDGKILPHTIGTAKEYALVLKNFLRMTLKKPDIGEFPATKEDIEEEQLKQLQNVTTQQFNKFFKGSQKLSDGSRRFRTQAIKAFYSYLHLQGLIGINPIIDYKPPVGKRAPKREIYFTEEDKEKLIKAVANKEGIEGEKEMEIADKTALRNTIIILLITENGFTITDITALDISDYNKKNHTLTKVSTGKKVPLSMRAYFLLDKYLETPADGIQIKGTRRSFRPKDEDHALFIGRRRGRLAERSVIYMVDNSIKRTFGDNSNFTPNNIRKKDD